MMNKRNGFTLVELLVVISIIALLLSVLMPSLNKARVQAQKTVCATNLKQWGIAITAYSTENGGRIPRPVIYQNGIYLSLVGDTRFSEEDDSDLYPEAFCVKMFESYMPGADRKNCKLSKSTWFCPSFTKIIDYYQTSDESWERTGYFHSSYAYFGRVKSWINVDPGPAITENRIPTGKIESVKNTALDFTTATAIGARIGEIEMGYDHNYIINKTNISPALAASVYEASSGNRMEVFTTQPGVHLYTGNLLDGVKGKGGAVYNQHDGFCLETQHFPDSPNKIEFPSVILKAGNKYGHCTIYKFSSHI